MKIAFPPRKDVSGPAPAMAARGIGLEAHQLIGAHFKRKISDLKQLRRALHREEAHTREREAPPRQPSPVSLHFQKDRTGGPRFDVPRLVVEKGTESRGSARYGQGWLLVLQNVRREAVLPSSDLLAKSLAHERWSGRTRR